MPRPPSCVCGHCRKCKRRIAARERYQNGGAEKVRQRIYRWREQHRDEIRDYDKQRPRRTQHLAQRRARNAVVTALRNGTLVPAPCAECGAQPTEAHHDDYSRPLDVVWLCATHHGSRHRTY